MPKADYTPPTRRAFLRDALGSLVALSAWSLFPGAAALAQPASRRAAATTLANPVPVRIPVTSNRRAAPAKMVAGHR